ncbi:MFS transporter [Roseivivax isoporae]|uniref:MFS transporter n=1 Tax=Roseivivax isoporae LMG 25204 TaxID=1449351 RepID=X7FDA4_9RHOB|nr:MFS transporter [Roseivivax isoporae]ETX30902.1 MFS transporter [Roseivivax isoporae LMG 25204]
MQMLGDLRASRGPAAAFAAMGVFWGGFAAQVPAVKAQVGLSDGGFGLALLVATVGAVAAMWLAPLAEARLGRHALSVATAASATVALFPGMIGDGVTFALVMLLGCMGLGVMDVVMNTRISLIESVTGRTLMNLNHAIYSLTYAFVALAVGLAREAGIAPAPIFLVLGAVMFGLTIIVATVRDPAAPADADDDADGPVVVRAPWALILPGGLIVCLAFLSEQATEGWSALHLERGHGAGAAAGALGPALLGLTMGIGRLSGQVLAQRLSERSVIAAATLIAAVGALVAAHGPGLGFALAGFTLMGLGLSVVVPMVFAWVGRLVPSRARAHAISRLSVVGYTGFFLGPPMMGFVSEGFGLSTSFTVIAVLLLVVPLALLPALGRGAMPVRAP